MAKQKAQHKDGAAPCEECDGTGAVHGPDRGEVSDCPVCGGSGKIRARGKSAQEDGATPRPWKMYAYAHVLNEPVSAIVHGADGDDVTPSCSECDKAGAIAYANAALIVRAVNAHDALADGAREAMAQVSVLMWDAPLTKDQRKTLAALTTRLEDALKLAGEEA